MSSSTVTFHGTSPLTSSSECFFVEPTSISTAPSHLFNQTVHPIDPRTLETKEEYSRAPSDRIPMQAPSTSPEASSFYALDLDTDDCVSSNDDSSDLDEPVPLASNKTFSADTTAFDIIKFAEALDDAELVQSEQRSSIKRISFYGCTQITDHSLPYLERICTFYPNLKTLNLGRTSISDAIRMSSLWKLRHLCLSHCYGVTPLPRDRDHDLHVETLNCGLRIDRKPDDPIINVEVTTYRTHQIYNKYLQGTVKEENIPQVVQVIPKYVGKSVRYQAAEVIEKIQWHRKPHLYNISHQSQKV